MAYNKDNLFLIGQGPLMGVGKRVWMYVSADPIATVIAAGYISNASAMGMKVRDVVWVLDTNVPTTNICSVIAITAGAADLGSGTALSETNST